METYIPHKIKIEQGQLCNFAVIICAGMNFNTRFFSVWSTMTLQEAHFKCVSRYLLLSILFDHFPPLPHQLFLLHPLWSILITCFEITSLVSPTVLCDPFFLVRFWSCFTSQHWKSVLNNNHGFSITKLWVDLIQETACLRIITLSKKVAASRYFATSTWFTTFPKTWSQYKYLGDNAGISGLITIHLGVGDDEQQSPTKEWKFATMTPWDCMRSKLEMFQGF